MALLSPLFAPMKKSYEALFNRGQEPHDAFHHERLQHPDEDIRLVRVVPDTEKDPEYEVQTFPLGACPQYTAVSYAWNRNAKTKYIIVNGRPFGVSKTLFEFLTQAADHSRARRWSGEWMWIDALCINLNDLDEKNQQVQNMKQIWEDSNAVVIWLGRAGDDSQLIPRMTETIINRSMKISGTIVPPTEKPFNRQQWTALSKIMERPWWTRAWVVSEITVPHPADDFNLWCGNWQLPFESFGLLTKPIDNTQIFGSTYYTPALAETSDPVKSLMNQVYYNSNKYHALNAARMRRQREEKLGPLTIYDFLWQMRTYECTDPRDRIYSFLSMTHDRTDPGLQPDYTVSVDQLYHRFAARIITRDQSLDLLTACSFDRKLRVPSWVPDWTAGRGTPHPFSIRRLSSGGKPGRLYRASLNFEPDIKVHKEGQALQVRGIIVDKVRRTSQTVGNKFIEDSKALGVQWREMAISHGPLDPTGAIGIEALEHVICADSEPTSPDNPYGVRGATINIPRYSETKFHDNFLVDPAVGAIIPWYRRLFTTTSNDWLGITTRRVQRGDLVCILFGAQMPMILRKEGEHYLLIGPAYVHRIMDGEALRGVDVEKAAMRFDIF